MGIIGSTVSFLLDLIDDPTRSAEHVHEANGWEKYHAERKAHEATKKLYVTYRTEIRKAAAVISTAANTMVGENETLKHSVKTLAEFVQSLIDAGIPKVAPVVVASSPPSPVIPGSFGLPTGGCQCFWCLRGLTR